MNAICSTQARSLEILNAFEGGGGEGVQIKSRFMDGYGYFLEHTNKGVVNGKCKTLQEGETSVFLCEPETF